MAAAVGLGLRLGVALGLRVGEPGVAVIPLIISDVVAVIMDSRGGMGAWVGVAIRVPGGNWMNGVGCGICVGVGTSVGRVTSVGVTAARSTNIGRTKNVAAPTQYSKAALIITTATQP